ncbi:hypothetical protein YPPY08_1836, partial [Yersinia pestis PY-08]
MATNRPSQCVWRILTPSGWG